MTQPSHQVAPVASQEVYHILHTIQHLHRLVCTTLAAAAVSLSIHTVVHTLCT
jgi:hypothetical protein